MPYKYLDEIATADVAFEAHGETLEELFAAASDATMNVMVDNIDGIARMESLSLSLDAETIDMLLFALLQELIFYKDARELLLRIENIRIVKTAGQYHLDAAACGEKINPAKHNLIVDVKAVTLHKFKVEQTPEGWETMVILDI
jgi:SHS2 domain-containing protein